MRDFFQHLHPAAAFVAGIATAIIGGIALLVLLTVGLVGLRSTNTYQIERVVPSPDGSHRAVLYTGMGGGAAGWCHQYLLIQVASLPQPSASQLEKAAEQPMFTGSCGSDIGFRWRQPDHLHVTYTIGYRGTSVYQNSRTRDGEIRLTYEILPE